MSSAPVAEAADADAAAEAADAGGGADVDAADVAPWLATLADSVIIKAGGLAGCPFVRVEATRALSHYLQSGAGACAEAVLAWIEAQGVQANGKHAAALLVAHMARPVDAARLARTLARLSADDRGYLIALFGPTSGMKAAASLLAASGPTAPETAMQKSFELARRQGNMCAPRCPAARP
jgi:hypothetical protein